MNISILAALLVFTVSVHTRASQSHEGFDLLKHSEFLALDRDDRAAYLDALRATALRSEQEASHFSSSETSSFFILLLLAQAHAAQGDMCIYAGYVSQRDSQNRCARPPGSSGSCGAGQTQCNPLLYGYGPGNSGGFCTGSRSTPTNDCEKQYQAMPNYKAYQVADQLVSKDMKAKFDAQAEKLSAYCSSSAAQGQAGLCKSLKDKTAFMKAKIAASEQRKKDKEAKAAAAAKKEDKPAAEKAQAADVSKEAAPVAKASAAPAPSAPATGTGGADGNSASVARAPATPAAPAPSATAAAAPAAAPAKAPEAVAKPAEVKKANLTPGGCLKNKDDYDAKKSSLPGDFQNLDKSPVYYTAHTPQVTSSMQLRLTDKGKFKLTSAVWASVISPWVSEDDISSICPSEGAPGVFVVTMDSGNYITVTAASGKIVAANPKKQKLEYEIDRSKGADLYKATTREVIDTNRANIWINNRDTSKLAK